MGSGPSKQQKAGDGKVLWDGLPRSQRSKWVEEMKKAGDLFNEPATKAVEDSVLTEIISGNIKHVLKQDRQVVRLFTSSTFTDTKDERDLLMDDVYPYLKLFCAELGLQFQVVDMRWGVREQTTADHGTSALCLSEVDHCLRESAGPAFVTMLGDKYGYRPFPASIKATEFDKLMAHLKATVGTDDAPHTKEDIELADKWFLRDDNAVPATYVLTSIAVHLPDFMSADRKLQGEASKIWWDIFERLQRMLRFAAIAVLPQDDADRYIMSVTEDEVRAGILENPDHAGRVFCFRRKIVGLDKKLQTLEASEARKYVDLVASGSDVAVTKNKKKKKHDLAPCPDARSLLSDLKDKDIEEKMGDDDWYVVDTKIDVTDLDLRKAAYFDYLKEFADTFCDRMTSSIIEQYRINRVVYDSHFKEVVQHRQFVTERGDEFVGRVDLVDKIIQYAKGTDGGNEKAKPLIVWGPSGSGKTSLMAKVSHDVASESGRNVMSRFCGTSANSSSIMELLASLCIQLERMYKDVHAHERSSVPYDVKELSTLFAKRLAYATSDKPLVVLIDSVDQLDDTDRGRQLGWLPLELPPNVRLIVSTLPLEGKCLPALCQLLQVEYPKDAVRTDSDVSGSVNIGPQFVQVERLSSADGDDILKMWLNKSHRTLTEAQRGIILKRFEATPYPLYLRLLFGQASKWRSYDKISEDEVGKSVRDVIISLFTQLEAKHGAKLVNAAFSLITASANGLTVTEIDDLLSLNDEVLQDVFQWWTPPLRRLPPLLWHRLRNDLDEFIADRGKDGATVLFWYHRQFWEAAENRYLSASAGNAKATSTAIAQYFGDVTPHAERRITPQPIRNNVGAVNRRKLTELPRHQIITKAWGNMYHTLCNVTFLEAAIEDGRVFSVIRDMETAMNQMADDASATEVLVTMKEYHHSITSYASQLAKQPFLAYQVIANEFEGSSPAVDARKLEASRKSNWLDLAFRPRLRDEHLPVSFTGHTNWVVTCAIHPLHDMIATGCYDGTARVWVSTTGEELKCIDYPGSRVNKVRFSPSGEHLFVAGNSGKIQRWSVTSDTTVLQDSWDSNHGDAWGMDVSANGKYLATGGNDNSVRVWELSENKMVWEAECKDAVKAVKFTQEGDRLATADWNGDLKIFEALTGKQLQSMVIKGSSKSQHKDSVQQGVSFSSGNKFAAAVCDDEVAVFDISSAVPKEVFHCGADGGRGFCCEFSPNGKFLLVGVESQRIVVYKTADWKKFRSLTGHPGSVRDVQFRDSSAGRKDFDFVSTDAGGTTKVWFGGTAENEPQDLPWHAGAVDSVKISSDGKHALVSGGGENKLWSTESGLVTGSMPSDDRIWAQNGSGVYSKEGTRSVDPESLLANADPEVPWELDGAVAAVSAGSTPKWMLSDKATLYRYKPKGPEKVASFTTEEHNFVWAVSDTHVALGGSNQMITIHKINDGDKVTTEVVHTLKQPSWANDARFSRDSKLLAIGGWTTDTCVVDVESGKPVFSDKSIKGCCLDILWSEDSTLVAFLRSELTVIDLMNKEVAVTLYPPERAAAGGKPGAILPEASGFVFGNGGGRVFVARYKSTQFGNAFEEARAKRAANI